MDCFTLLYSYLAILKVLIMGKVLPKKKITKLTIRSLHIDVRSHVDDVRHSLEDLIFSETKETERSLFKKRIKVVLSLTILFMIVGSYLSPKGKADSSIFYPTTCLGGWNNPHNAEGEPQLKSNENEEDFTDQNSAILPETIKAEIYCGNFVGAVQEKTRPTKILVSLSWSKGKNILTQKKVEGESFASSTGEILDHASTTEVSFTLVDPKATSSETQTATSSENSSVTKEASSTSLVNDIVDSVQDTFKNIFEKENQSSSSSAVTPSDPSLEKNNTIAPSVENSQKEDKLPVEENKPTSFLDNFIEKIVRNFVKNAYAEEIASTTEVNLPSSDILEKNVTDVVSTTTATEKIALPEEIKENSKKEETLNSEKKENSLSLENSTTTVDATTTENASSTNSPDIALGFNLDEESQNNFLEVFYTLDGVLWKSLGKVDEKSMKYRTFEIPTTATTSWADLSRIQIKVQLLDKIDLTPAVYLDGIAMEVLYETPVIHEHPDFDRDVLLKDKTDDGIRVVTINNSDTNAEEIWYTTVIGQGEYGVAPGSWVEIPSDQAYLPYKFIDIYGQNIFLLDEAQKLLWVKNLQKETNDGIGLVLGGTTTVQFVKANGEEWIFDYHYKTKNAVVRIKG